MSTSVPSRNPLRSIARVGLAGALVLATGGAALTAINGSEPAEAAPMALAAPAGDDSELATLDFGLPEFDDRAALTSRMMEAERGDVTFSVVIDGETIEVASSGATLSEALAAAGIVVDGDDVVSQHLGDPVEPGTVLTVNRVTSEHVSEEVIDEHGTVEVESDDLYKGQSEVTTRGVDGRSTVTYIVTYQDGVETSRTPSSLRSPRTAWTRSSRSAPPIVRWPRRPAPAAAAVAAAAAAVPRRPRLRLPPAP